MKRLFVAIWVLPCFGALRAQEQQAAQAQLLAVTVTAVAGRSVYLDRGRDDGVLPGTVVRLIPAGGGPIEVAVRASSSRSARAEVPPGLLLPPVGTRGEAEVVSPTATAPTTPRMPERAPWTRQEAPRDPDQPLLVPTYGRRPDERPMQVSGRLIGFAQYSQDRGGDRDVSYLLARLGGELQATNPFGRGGRLQLAGEYDQREVDGAPGDRGQGRLELLSYREGDEAHAPLGFEIGRFVPCALPELGLVDGIEGIARFEGGVRLGAGLGSYPLPFPERTTGEDLGCHFFADFGADGDRAFAATIGYQKTWHEGAPDRDLVLLRLEGRPLPGLWYYATAKVDVYTSGDQRKDSGPDLTEFLAQVRWDGSTVGAGLQASHFTWPDLLREEYRDLPDELVRDGRVDRLSGDVSFRVLPDLRLRLRCDLWEDQQRDGTAVELAGDANDVFGSGLQLHAALFRSDGSYASGPGARLRLQQRWGDVLASLGWSWLRYDLDDLISGSETYTRQSLLLGLDFTIGDADVSLNAEYWYGDQEDALALGVYGQSRF